MIAHQNSLWKFIVYANTLKPQLALAKRHN